MTPAARLSAAIEILDTLGAGGAAEQALTNWGRRSRFAGSGDRAAVRDLVFDAIRCRRSFGALGGGATGRALMIGRMRAMGEDPDTLFTGVGHAPEPLSDAERNGALPMDPLVALDCPDWLAPRLQASLGPDFAAVMTALQSRAPVFLRVNTARTTAEEVQAMLAGDGVVAVPCNLSKNALQVTENARKIQNSRAYQDGLVELQDAASQAVVDLLPLVPGNRVLDYCAGGGGKSLAMAARSGVTVLAHDSDPRRMRDLSVRAERAQVRIDEIDGPGVDRLAPYDLVLADVPCSGSGSWRRAPEAKWTLTQDRLAQLTEIQSEILDRVAGLVAPGGYLAYATCSLLACENDDQITAFLARKPGWTRVAGRSFTPLDGGDGFFVAILKR
jgi:16S rRNA (cytosine967-C5)-methyltransferase